MDRVVDLADKLLEKKAKSAFALWPRRLEHQPSPDQRLDQLPGPVLQRLAELGPQAVLALYDLVLGARGWGRGEDFDGLPASQKMEALDVYLFLADQVRFELMRRLGWVEPSLAGERSMLDMALNWSQIKDQVGNCDPKLTKAYPRYGEVAPRLEYEPGAVLRSLIPEALFNFKRRLDAQ